MARKYATPKRTFETYYKDHVEQFAWEWSDATTLPDTQKLVREFFEGVVAAPDYATCWAFSTFVSQVLASAIKGGRTLCDDAVDTEEVVADLIGVTADYRVMMDSIHGGQKAIEDFLVDHDIYSEKTPYPRLEIAANKIRVMVAETILRIMDEVNTQ